MTTDHKKEITDLLTKYKSILIDDLLSNKSVLQCLVEETIIDKNDLEFLLQTDDSESENELNDKKCQYLIDIISKDGLKCFKKFCYTIESDCKMLITALINDSLNYGKFLIHSICPLIYKPPGINLMCDKQKFLLMTNNDRMQTSFNGRVETIKSETMLK